MFWDLKKSFHYIFNGFCLTSITVQSLKSGALFRVGWGWDGVGWRENDDQDYIYIGPTRIEFLIRILSIVNIFTLGTYYYIVNYEFNWVSVIIELVPTTYS